MKSPRDDREYVQSLEKRISRLERRLLPWQLNVGAFGDLVADNLETGRRVTVAQAKTWPQNTEE